LKFWSLGVNPASAIQFGQTPEDQDWYPTYTEFGVARSRQYLGIEQVPQLKLFVSRGKVLKDFSINDLYFWTLSTRAVEAIHSCGVTGIETVPYEVEGCDLVKVVHRIIVKGRCSGMHRPGTSELSDCLIDPTKRFSYFDINTWDGSDVFIDPDRLVHTYFTDRAVKCLKKHKLSIPFDADVITNMDEYRALYKPGTVL
jgi:hypothetical protein